MEYDARGRNRSTASFAATTSPSTSRRWRTSPNVLCGDEYPPPNPGLCLLHVQGHAAGASPSGEVRLSAAAQPLRVTEGTWGEVDLRWGISDEQKAEGKVLALCLEEIHRCGPYFIGLLGERYGWVPLPQSISPALVEQQAWLKTYGGRSVTELEIIHGVLRDQEMHRHAIFYFRDRGWLDRLPTGAQRSDFESDSPEASAQLNQLKQQIRNARDELVCQLRENFRDSQELGQWIIEDFTRLINVLWPASRHRDPLDREADDQEAFAESRSRVYIGRPEYFERLDAFAMGRQPPLVIVGESGSGKSALLANWALRHRAANPRDFVLTHFIGVTPHSSDWTALLRRIMAELKRHFGIDREIPGQPDALRAAFGNWLHMAGARGRDVLILDALDQLEDRNGASDLVWLPPVIPANVRLVLSSLRGRSPDELDKRGWGTFRSETLDSGERAELIKASRDDDRCRLRTPKGQWIHSMFNRWANSLFRHWSDQRPNGHHLKTSDLIARIARNYDERAVRALTSKGFPS